MNIKCLQAFMLAGCLSLQALALAQPPRGADHPSHRYLPPPIGAGTLADQINSLERLNNSAHAPAPGDQAAPLELSPAQLKQLDSILESFRGEDGQPDIPSPDSIPKQWIDSLLPDPKQRQQAKEMLEQYSRTRNLPLKSNNDPGGLPPIDDKDSESKPPTPGTSSSQSQPRRQSPNDGLRDIDRNKIDRDKSNGFQSPDIPPRTSSGAVDDPFSRERQAKQPDNAKGGNAQGGERPGSDSSSDNDQPGSFQLPKDTPPALRDLYETLKKFQQQNTQEQRETTSSRMSRKAAEARERAANAPARSDPRSPRPITPNNPTPSSGASKTGNAARPTAPRPSNAATPTQPGRTRPQPQLTDNDAANGIGAGAIGQGNSDGPSSSGTPSDPSSGDSSLRNPNRNPSGTNQPEPSVDPRSRNLNPFEEGFDFSSQPPVPANPFSQAEDPTANPNGGRNPGKKFSPPQRPAEPFNVKRMAQQPSPQPPQSRPGPGGQPPLGSGGNSAEPSGQTDWKKSVNELGLGPALKRIVEKTLKEQGFDPKNPAGPRQTGAGQTGAGQTASSGPGASAAPPNLPSNMPSPQTFEQLKKWGNSVATTPNNSGGSTANNSTSNANSGWGRWAADTWKSMAESSARSQSSPRSSSSSSAPSSSWASGASSSAASGGLPEFRWTSSMTFAVLFVAALVLLVVWFSRQRMAERSDSSAAQAEWVRTVIAQGLKTRADVIRAFHQLVKQSRSVSDWWTHRSIVKHFSTHTPQLAPAISELAMVYEQARYFPEDVELSPQQLAQVRTLLESVKIPTSNRV